MAVGWLLVVVCAGLAHGSVAMSTPTGPPTHARWLALAATQPALPPPTQPALAVLSDCSYAAAQFGLDGSGLRPGERTTVEVMPTSDPLAGRPMSARAMTANAAGRFVALLDVPATAATSPIVRSVRLRPNPPLPGRAGVLASARLKTASRAVSIRPSAPAGRAGTTERWLLVGLPEGTRLWAHYRHGGAVADVALATAKDPCGRARFALRTLPAGHERQGRWDVWITTARVFRPRRDEIYVQRRMTVVGAGAGARVRFAPLRSRLLPGDRRAVAPRTAFLAADSTRIGIVRELFAGAGGAPVQFFERIGDRLAALGSARSAPGEDAVLEDATTWSCSRRTRRFMAFASLPGGFLATGVHTIRTPSCANRFRIVATRRGAAGRAVVVRVVDRWGTGAITPRLCVAAPRRRMACRRLPFPHAVTIASRGFRASGPGLWRIDLRIRGMHVRGAIRVGAGGSAPRAVPALLATGDSMMLGLDSFLGDELAGTQDVRSDVRPGTGISRIASDWMKIAVAQASAQRPRTTVIMLGAADGFPMTTPGGASVVCCGRAWTAEYARRAGAMMRSYLRHGRGRVYWLTVPIPRQVERLPIILAVNAAIRHAAAGVAGVSVVGLDVLFTPHGYRDVVRYRGRDVRVRDVDGLHLSLQGQAIAAKAVARFIRQAPPGA
jgi:lysophospholipase L1-like esterase